MLRIRALAVAAAFVATAGALATFAAVLMPDTPAGNIAAVTGVAAVAAVGFLPSLSARFARLPVGFSAPGQTRTRSRDYDEEAERAEAVQYERIAHQARRGHEVLVGLVGGCAAVVVGACAVLSFTDRTFPELLALALGIATMLRARLFRYTAQVLSLTAAGLLGLCLLIVGLSLHTPQFILRTAGAGTDLDLRTIWLAASIAFGAALLTAIALVVPRLGVSPFWGRILDLVDSLTLISLVPLALAVLNIYRLVRGATG